MKRLRLIVVLSGFGLSAFLQPAEALTFIDTLTFPVQTVAADQQSGTGLDFFYEHSLAALPPEAQLTAAVLSFTHSGNLNDGPTREVWDLVAAGAGFVGRLSFSENIEATDRWPLDASLLDLISRSRPSALQLALSEQTSYNGEALRAIRSQLEIEYEDAGSAAGQSPVTVPEPGAGFILSAGLAAAGLRKKLIRRKV